MSKLLPALISATGLGEIDLRMIISNAPSRYKKFPIKKRDGSDRIIAQPAKELKALQRALIECCLSSLPIHDAAMAYRTGRSILDNAKRHSGSGPIRKYDFNDFFHSIRSEDWRNFCTAHSVFDLEVDYLISERLIFQRDKGSRILKLSIGAPSSPIVSNILMFEFDSAISAAVSKDDVIYTRYADDLTFSARRTGYLTVVDAALREIVRNVPWPRLSINEKKTVVATKKYRREVTGLVLSNEGAVSLGRDRKRNIRAALHKASLQQLSAKDLSYLCGLLSFANAIEPGFLERMEARYGSDVIKYVKQHGHVTRRDWPPKAL